MRTWIFRLQSLFTNINWEAELIEASFRQDWDIFSLALHQRPQLFTYRTKCGELSLIEACVKSERIALVKEYFTANEGRWAPDPPIIAATVLSLELNNDEIFKYLWEKLNPLNRYRVTIEILQTFHRKGIDKIDFASVFKSVKECPGDIPPPLVAVILGNGDLDLVKKIAYASPDHFNKMEFAYSEGYGHDNDPVYFGRASFFASHFKRPQIIIDFLVSREY